MSSLVYTIDGTDYSGGDFTVTFPVNETQVSFNISNDDEPPLEGELGEFNINFISVPSGATPGELLE